MIRKKREKFNPSRVWLDREIADFGKQLPPGGRVLDAGAGDQRYRCHFQHMDYEAADFEKVDKPYAQSTYVCDLADIPVENERFDGIIFSQVMEHLPYPAKTLSELHRVLKPGGKLFYSAPLFYEEHEKPYDFYRYTQFSINLLFKDAGFSIERLDWLEGYMGTLNYQLRRMARHLPFRPSQIGGGPMAWATVTAFIPLKISAIIAAYGAGRCDIRTRYKGSGFPINYVAIVKKPQD